MCTTAELNRESITENEYKYNITDEAKNCGFIIGLNVSNVV